MPGLDVAREAADGDYRVIWGRRCFFGDTVDPSGEVWWFANPLQAAPDDEAAGPAERRRRLVDLLAADAGPAAAIVEARSRRPPRPGPLRARAPPRVDRVTRWGARMRTAKAPGRVGRAVRDLALPLVLARASSPRALR